MGLFWGRLLRFVCWLCFGFGEMLLLVWEHIYGGVFVRVGCAFGEVLWSFFLLYYLVYRNMAILGLRMDHSEKTRVLYSTCINSHHLFHAVAAAF
jgi:hypothetical protein